MKKKWMWFLIPPIAVMVWLVQKFVSHHAHTGHNWVHHRHHNSHNNNHHKRD